MQGAVIKPLTVVDFRELPDGPPYYQLIEGDLFMSPTPSFYHQEIVGNIHLIVGTHLMKQPSGKIIIAPSDVVLNDINVFEPDLYFISNERKSIITEQGVTGAPDLVIEVLSPGTAKYDRGVKRHIYARSGVREMWLVDPVKKEIAVYRFDAAIDKPVAVYSGRQKFSTPLLPKLQIAVTKVFAS